MINYSPVESSHMAHTFDPANADRLDDISRYRYCSRDELVGYLDPPPDGTVLDLGSGTGFYTTDVAPFTNRVYGVDVQPTMHGLFEANDVPPNVRLITAEIENLPLETGSIDRAFSTMTFHEFAVPAAIDEIARVLRPGSRFVNVDWSQAGEGEAGPPLSERQDAASARQLIESADFEVTDAIERVETFVLVAVNR